MTGTVTEKNLREFADRMGKLIREQDAEIERLRAALAGRPTQAMYDAAAGNADYYCTLAEQQTNRANALAAVIATLRATAMDALAGAALKDEAHS